MDTGVIEDYIGQLLSIERDFAPFFENLRHTNEKDDYANILNVFLDKIQDTFISKIIIIEIDKLNSKINLSSLLDFVLTKKREDFNSGFELVDFQELKILAVKTIANYKDSSAVTPLLYCLNNKGENYKFRLTVAEALGKIGDNSAVDSLIRIVKDENEKSVYVRESAAHALGVLGDKRAVEPFLDILESKKSFLSKFTFLKERVLEALGRLNIDENKRIRDILSNALQDECTQVRLNALETISNNMMYDMFDDVKELLEDKNEEISSDALVVLYNISDRKILDEIIQNPESKPHLIEKAKEILEEGEEDE